MLKDFEQPFVRYADVPTIARFARIKAARSASKAQLAFTGAFQGYICRNSAAGAREFQGGRIDVAEAKASGKLLRGRPRSRA